MAKLNLIVAVLCVLGSAVGQLTFPGQSDSPSTSPQKPTPPVADAPASDAPAGEGQTRFFIPGLFGGPPSPPVGPIAPGFSGQFGGGIPGQGFQGQSFQGQFGPGPFIPGQNFQGQSFVGPPGFQAGFQGQVLPGQTFGGQGGFGGVKPGSCRFEVGASSGFNRFAQTSCVTGCRGDFECSGVRKCCPVGCSSICRVPPEFEGVSTPGFIQPTSKPGSCPGLIANVASILGLRSGAGGSPGSTRSLAADAPADAAGEGESRTKRSPQFRDRDDRRERRLSRLERTRGRVTRQAAEPDQRFFLPNPFCIHDCQNDFHCSGNEKCCLEHDCRKCKKPTFF